MATFASLIVEIGAKMDKLTKGLADASSKIGAFVKDAAGKLLDVGKWVVGGIGVAIGAITYMILSTTTKIAELDDTAKRFGLPVDELQRFQYAAKLAGVEAESLGMAFQFMLKNVAEAGSDPAGPAAESFRKLGLNAQALSKLDTAAQFTRIGEAFGRIANQGQKVQLAMDIFGRSGAQILNVFADNMQAARKEFDSLGLALTDVQVEAVAKFDDTRDKLGAIWGGFKEQVTAAVAPAFDFIYSYIIETIKRFGGIRGAAFEMGAAIVDSLIFAADGVAKFITGTLDAVDKAIIKFDRLAIAILKIAKNPYITPKTIDDPNDTTSFFKKDQIPNPVFDDINSSIDSLERDMSERMISLGKESGKTLAEELADGLSSGLKEVRSKMDTMRDGFLSGKNAGKPNAPMMGFGERLAASSQAAASTGGGKIDNAMSDRDMYAQNQSGYYERKFGQLDQTIADMKAVREKFPGTPFGTTGDNLQMAATKPQTNVNVSVSYDMGGDPILNQIMGSLKFKSTVGDQLSGGTNTVAKAIAN